ncbi:MAG: hypothetical protein J2P46_08755 [Zavarzinella sp.]|nr:hypothetical protein [Zavarzinella sp.]
MNTAVLMLSACLAGQVPVAPPPGYAPYPAPVYTAPAYPAYQGAPAVVAMPGQSCGGSCCGHASVCGDCEGQAHKCCLLGKLKCHLSCIHIDLCGSCNKGCNTGCNQGCAPACPKPACNPCPKPVCPKVECPKPVCNPCPKVECPKPVCNPCPKVECPKPTPVCCKAETVSHGCCTGACWTPGYFLHKCKEKLSCCGNGCHGGCGTAATPTACGSTVIPPATVPVGPAPVVPVQPDLRKMPEKVGSNYGPVQANQPAATSAPRTIDLGAPF